MAFITSKKELKEQIRKAYFKLLSEKKHMQQVSDLLESSGVRKEQKTPPPLPSKFKKKNDKEEELSSDELEDLDSSDTQTTMKTVDIIPGHKKPKKRKVKEQREINNFILSLELENE